MQLTAQAVGALRNTNALALEGRKNSHRPFRRSPCQAEGNDGLCVAPGRLLESREQVIFEVVGIGNHFTGRDPLAARALKTKLAHSQPIVRPHRRPKYSTSHRTRFVQLA